jgi:FMN phosphatase YigB (HAD superfamily)
MPDRPIDCVILDFDGTFTDVQKEAAPFERVYLQNLNDLLGRDVSDLWRSEQAFILARPADFGWEFAGQKVAPATADPYLLATATAIRVFDQLGVLKHQELRTEITQVLYREAYQHTVDVFRPDARRVLEHIIESGRNVFVVTNSDTEIVRRKIRGLGAKGSDNLHVVGDARKYMIVDPTPVDERFLQIPVERRVDGLPRSILLRRGRYYEALRKLWTDSGTTPERTLVCGDIYELDLALPDALGSSVHLVLRKNALDYERRAIEAAAPRGGMSDELAGVLDRL